MSGQGQLDQFLEHITSAINSKDHKKAEKFINNITGSDIKLLLNQTSSHDENSLLHLLFSLDNYTILENFFNKLSTLQDIDWNILFEKQNIHA